jgi:stearoyl-CoA desaturase (delta-9 desaturase)
VAADSEKDIHSPYQLGNWQAWFGFWNYPSLRPKLINDIRKDAFHKWMHRHYLWIIFIYCAILAAIDPMLVIFFYCIPACLCLHSSSAIIVIAHRHGYTTHKLRGNDQARNSWIANLITLGEGWHNNHHARPYAWSNWEQWWEWDVPSLIIRCIKK